MVACRSRPRTSTWGRSRTTEDHLPGHDERKRKLAEDKDLDASSCACGRRPRPPSPGLRGRRRVPVEQRTGLKQWTIGSLSRTFETRRAGQPIKAYPALVDEASPSPYGSSTPSRADRGHVARHRRLILLNVPTNPAKFATDRLTNQDKLACPAPARLRRRLFDDCVTAAADRLIADHGGPAWDEESFRKLFDSVRADLVELTIQPSPASARSSPPGRPANAA